MRGRKLVGWNGCRKKRFRAAFWFKLTELIFTVIQMTGLRSCTRAPDTLYQAAKPRFDEGKTKIPPGKLNMECSSSEFIFCI